MIAAIQFLEKNVSRNANRLVAEFEAATNFEVPINYRDEAGFHFYATDPGDAVEMFVFTDC